MQEETARTEDRRELLFEPLPRYLRKVEPTQENVAEYRKSGIYSLDLSERDELTRSLGVRIDVKKLREISEPRIVWVRRNPDGAVLNIASEKAKGVNPKNAKVVPDGRDYSEIALLIYDCQSTDYRPKIRAW